MGGKQFTKNEKVSDKECVSTNVASFPSSLLSHFMGSRYRFQSTIDVGVSGKT